MSKAVIFFADGFEECEGLLVVDLMRRGGLDITTASITGSKTVVSSHKISLEADALIEDVDFSDVDIIVLPGGMPGTTNLLANEKVCALCREFAENKKIAAVCAAPSVFGELGLLEGKNATVYPGFEGKLKGATPSYDGVTVDGNVITGRALGSSIDFALEIIKALEGEEKANSVAKQICY